MRLRDLASFGVDQLNQMLQYEISKSKGDGVTMDHYPSLENMIEWGMWPYPDEKEFKEMVKIHGGHMLAAYSMAVWAAKMEIKGLMEMGMWTMMDGSMVSMMQGMMSSDHMWDQVQQGSACLYDMMAMDEVEEQYQL